MEHTREFDCPVCGTHLDSREQLNQHRESAHPAGARSASESSQSDTARRGAQPGKASTDGVDESRLA